MVRREWEPEELIVAWTLLDDDWELVANKADATRLGFCLLLKFFELEARFPRHVGELPQGRGGVRGRAGQGRSGCIRRLPTGVGGAVVTDTPVRDHCGSPSLSGSAFVAYGSLALNESAD